jgi:putative Mn2+ efflux pump MntP
MPPVTLVLIALGVSADAFAVAVGKGLSMRRLDLRRAGFIAAAFGLAQAVMPLLGWLVGIQLERVITEFDHWIAFGLLAAVGGKMLYEALTGNPDRDEADRLDVRELLVLSVATSIDALAVGVGFAFLPVSIGPAVVLIGLITLVVSFAGVLLGHRAGARWRRPAEALGGLVLIAIGLRILFDHLGMV